MKETILEETREKFIAYVDNSHIYKTVKRHIKSHINNGRLSQKDICCELEYCRSNYDSRDTEKIEEIKNINNYLTVYNAVKDLHQAIGNLSSAGYSEKDIMRVIDEAYTNNEEGVVSCATN